MRKYLGILFLFTSCTVNSNLTISEETKQQQLQDITTQYHRNIYFGSFEQAALKVAAKNKVSFVTRQHNRKKEENLADNSMICLISSGVFGLLLLTTFIKVLNVDKLFIKSFSVNQEIC